MKKINYTLLLIIGTLFCCCKKEYFDYAYLVTNKTDIDSLFISCTIVNTNENINGSAVIAPNDTLSLTKRFGVAGKEIWDIETSVELYKIKNLIAYNKDSTLKSLNLCYKDKYWEGPININNEGVYFLNITDEKMALEVQDSFLYRIKNELDDPIKVTLKLVRNKETNNFRQDTIIQPQESVRMGYTIIYNYRFPKKDSLLYKEQKISGIHQLVINYNGKDEIIEPRKKLSLFIIDTDSCELIVRKNLFE
jgi:hypothetical protein